MKNIIMSSVGRCGASWVCGVISEIHRQTYGEVVNWNWGISRYIATTNTYYFPEGFNQVLYINPLNLLKRPYDKIIIVKRDLEGVLKSMQEYRYPELTYKETQEQYPQFLETVEYYWHVCYDHDFDDPRIYLVDLGDLNNHTVATFSDLLDFLEYPTNTYQDIINHIETNFELMDKKQIIEYFIEHPLRPAIVPVNTPLRNWAVIATQINKQYGCDGLQKGIQKHDTTNKHIKMIETPEETPKIAHTQFIHELLRPNPYVMSPEEYKLQKCVSFRIHRPLMPDALKILEILK